MVHPVEKHSGRTNWLSSWIRIRWLWSLNSPKMLPRFMWTTPATPRPHRRKTVGRAYSKLLHNSPSCAMKRTRTVNASRKPGINTRTTKKTALTLWNRWKILVSYQRPSKRCLYRVAWSSGGRVTPTPTVWVSAQRHSTSCSSLRKGSFPILTRSFRTSQFREG